MEIKKQTEELLFINMMIKDNMNVLMIQYLLQVSF